MQIKFKFSAINYVINKSHLQGENVTNTSNVFDRLKLARKNLGLTQAEAADLCGVKRETWSRYESGLMSPGMDVLAAIAAAGADINYILTGIRMHPAPVTEGLTREEAALLDNFRHTDKADQAAIKRMALLAAGAAKAEKEQIGVWDGTERRKNNKQ